MAVSLVHLFSRRQALRISDQQMALPDPEVLYFAQKVRPAQGPDCAGRSSVLKNGSELVF